MSTDVKPGARKLVQATNFTKYRLWCARPRGFRGYVMMRDAPACHCGRVTPTEKRGHDGDRKRMAGRRGSSFPFWRAGGE